MGHIDIDFKNRGSPLPPSDLFAVSGLVKHQLVEFLRTAVCDWNLAIVTPPMFEVQKSFFAVIRKREDEKLVFHVNMKVPVDNPHVFQEFNTMYSCQTLSRFVV
jgi:hypothetical protein